MDDVDKMIEDCQKCIESDPFHSQLQATEYEKQTFHMKKILKKFDYDQVLALNHWNAWVRWRHGKGLFF